jgi:hypothetical protein
MAAVVAVVAIGDHHRIAPRSRSQHVLLDRAHPRETTLRAHLAGLLEGEVVAVRVIKLDLVNDTTLVDVRWRPSEAPGTDPNGPGSPRAAALEAVR